MDTFKYKHVNLTLEGVPVILLLTLQIAKKLFGGETRLVRLKAEIKLKTRFIMFVADTLPHKDSATSAAAAPVVLTIYY